MFKCVYNGAMNKCNATASVVYTTAHVTKWQPLLSTINCTVSKYISLLEAILRRLHVAHSTFQLACSTCMEQSAARDSGLLLTFVGNEVCHYISVSYRF